MTDRESPPEMADDPLALAVRSLEESQSAWARERRRVAELGRAIVAAAIVPADGPGEP